MPSDEDLFRQWQRGDREALDDLVRQYQGPLLSHLYNLTGNVKTAEDLLQETFVRLVREAQSYQYPRPFYRWLYRIARNLALNHVASAYHRHVELGVSLTESIAQESDLEAQAERGDELRHLQAALINLSFEQREVLSLRFIQELSIDEVAKLLAIPAGTVKSRTFQALQHLRRYLAENSRQEDIEPTGHEHA